MCGRRTKRWLRRLVILLLLFPALLYDAWQLMGYFLGMNPVYVSALQAISIIFACSKVLRAFGHLGWMPGNQVDGLVSENDLVSWHNVSEPSVPILEMTISLQPSLWSVTYCSIQALTILIASIGLGASIVGGICSAYPLTTLGLIVLINTLGALIV